jgi:PAS domain S-box-containing protein
VSCPRTRPFAAPHFVTWLLAARIRKIELVRIAAESKQHTAERETHIAEQALKESTTLLKAISDSTGNVVFAKDRAGQLTFANPATLALVAKNLEQVLGKTDAEFLEDKAAAQQVMANDRRVMDSEVGEDFEEVVPLSDGTERIWLSRKMPYRNEHGEVIGLLGVSRDITDRAQTESALRQSERRFRELANAMPQIVWAADPDGRIDYFNRKWYELTKKPETEDGTQSWLAVMRPDDRQKSLDHWRVCVSIGQPYEIEHRFKFPGSSEYRWHLGRALPVQDRGSRIVRSYGTSTDVHDFKRAEEGLRSSEERLAGIVTSAMDAIITVDRNYNVVVFNRAAEETFSIRADDAVGKSLDQFIPERFRKDHHAHVVDFGRTGVTSRNMQSPGVLVGLRSDGTEFPIEATISQMEVRGETVHGHSARYL